MPTTFYNWGPQHIVVAQEIRQALERVYSGSYDDIHDSFTQAALSINETLAEGQ